MNLKNVLFFVLVCMTFSCSKQEKVEWVSSTYENSWVNEPVLTADASSGKVDADVVIDPTKTKQTIAGFGTCFNELGWTSLCKLDSSTRESILKEMFYPGEGANFTICRMPVAANDFALDWYSYNEVDKDFEMKNFSIDNDRKTLIPFIKAAKRYNSDIKIWASPWSPPTWMKYNKHYASSSTMKMARLFKERAQDGETTYMFKVVDNGLPEDREGFEGTDMFIQEEEYFKAYALYFSKFIDAYKAEGIDIFGVMPQNEFNSAQIFPSCCWTARGLAEFVGKYLGPVMNEKGVEVMFGTMERPNVALVDTILNDSECSKYVKAVGFQWAGKDALPGVYAKYPDLKLIQSEQECGDGKNNWEGAIHSWDLMKHYLKNGVSIYEYWNTSLMQGGISRWGWAQNSLVVVSEDGKSFKYTPEYYIMKHVSHYVLPGAKRIETSGSYDDVLTFVNLDGSIVVIAGNNDSADKKLSIKVNDKIFTPTLKSKSINTFVL